MRIEDQHPGLAVGTLIWIRDYYTWWERDEWIAHRHPAKPESSSHFDHRPTVSFYYIVTSIDAEAAIKRPRYFENNRYSHRAIVSIVGGAISKRENKLQHAWTCTPGHKSWHVEEDQQSPIAKQLREMARPFFGLTAEHLL